MCHRQRKNSTHLLKDRDAEETMAVFHRVHRNVKANPQCPAKQIMYTGQKANVYVVHSIFRTEQKMHFG